MDPRSTLEDVKNTLRLYAVNGYGRTGGDHKLGRWCDFVDSFGKLKRIWHCRLFMFLFAYMLEGKNPWEAVAGSNASGEDETSISCRVLRVTGLNQPLTDSSPALCHRGQTNRRHLDAASAACSHNTCASIFASLSPCYLSYPGVLFVLGSVPSVESTKQPSRQFLTSQLPTNPANPTRPDPTQPDTRPNQATNQPANQPTSQQTNRPTNQPTNKHASTATNQFSLLPNELNQNKLPTN